MNKIRQAALVALACLAVVTGALTLGWEHAATATPTPHRYTATLICPNGLAEDSAGHVRLVDFSRNADGTVNIVYRCKKFGY